MAHIVVENGRLFMPSMIWLLLLAALAEEDEEENPPKKVFYGPLMYLPGTWQAAKDALVWPKVLISFHSPGWHADPRTKALLAFEKAEETFYNIGYFDQALVFACDGPERVSIWYPGGVERSLVVRNMSTVNDTALEIVRETGKILKRYRRLQKAQKKPEVARIKGEMRALYRLIKGEDSDDKKIELKSSLDALGTQLFEHVKPEKQIIKGLKIQRRIATVEEIPEINEKIKSLRGPKKLKNRKHDRRHREKVMMKTIRAARKDLKKLVIEERVAKELEMIAEPL